LMGDKADPSRGGSLEEGKEEKLPWGDVSVWGGSLVRIHTRPREKGVSPGGFPREVLTCSTKKESSPRKATSFSCGGCPREPPRR